MLKKLMNEKLLMAAIGLAVTLLNTFLNDLFSDGQLYAFAAIVVGFIIRAKDPSNDDLQKLLESIHRAETIVGRIENLDKKKS